MKRNRVMVNVATIFVAVWLTNCLTVNVTVNFPEAEVENAADEINREIRGDIFSEQTEEGSAEGSSWLHVPNPFAAFSVAVSFGMPAAHAEDQKIDLKTTNPIIRKINQQRTERAKQINEYLTKKYVGEGKDGYLKERPGMDALEMVEKAKTSRVVKEENADRKTLYDEFAKINDLPAERVAKVFAESNRKWLLAGQQYQKDDGEWVEKTKEQEKKDREELKKEGHID